jgi:phosphatidylserine decarboxylase
VNTTAIRDENTRGRSPAAWWKPVGWYASLVGWSARRHIPRPLRAPVYGAFSRVVGADVGEAERRLDEYTTFGDFFARRLREGARRFDAAPDALIAPCDGRLAASGAVGDGTLVQAKGRDYALAELLCDDIAAARFEGGWFATIYLSPADYHRVHAPLDGKITAYDYVPGALWPVKPFFTRNVDGLFAKNERAVIHLDTAVGPVAVVMVSAVGVGNIFLSHPGTDSRGWRSGGELRRLELPEPVPVKRGDELGAFLLGSTVIVVTPPGVVPEAPAEGEVVRCGHPIARIARPAR